MKIRKTNFWSGTYDLFNYITLTLFMISCVYPFYYIFIYSISDPQEARKGLNMLPIGLTFDNYIRIFRLQDIFSASMISLVRTISGTILTIFCCTFFAYLLTKKELYFRKLIYRLSVITLYFNAGLIPWYLAMKSFGLRNNFLVYIIPTAVNVFFVILIKTYIEQISPELEESAMIDGAGYFTVFLKIIFPVSKPIIATIAVFAAVNQWNSWIDNMLLVTDDKLQTLQYMLYNYLNEAQTLANKSMQELSNTSFTSAITPESIKMTITMVVTLPILLVYPFLQKYFVKGIMLGAIKG